MTCVYYIPYLLVIGNVWAEEAVEDSKKMVEDKATQGRNILAIFAAEVGKSFGALVLR